MCVCVSDDYPPAPQTPSLAQAYEQGILDGSFGQQVSFQSSYKSAYRIEVPVWRKVDEGITLAKGDSGKFGTNSVTKAVPSTEGQVPAPNGNQRQPKRKLTMSQLDKDASLSNKVSCLEQKKPILREA